MFTHKMATKVLTATKVLVTEMIRDDRRVKVSGVFGGGSPFKSNLLMLACQRQITGMEYEAFLEFVQERSLGKAPPRECRDEDWVAWLDLYGWGETTWVAPVEEEVVEESEEG